MSDVEWIKITVGMFDNRKIKHIRKLPEGNDIVLIWVMLLTMAGRCNAGGFIYLTENIPYTVKTLADELGFNESTIATALDVLDRFDMVKWEDELLSIPGWEEYQNAEKLEKVREQTRKRVTEYREKQRKKGESLECNAKCNAENSVTCNAGVTLQPALHDALRNGDVTQQNKNKNKNKEKDIKNIAHDEMRNAQELFEKLWKSYPCKKGKGHVSDKQKRKLLAIGEQELLRAIERYKSELKKDEDWRRMQYGSTFFNSGYVD